jgi:2-methylisocitrate lyase-like PEP mutase family enzyme
MYASSTRVRTLRRSAAITAGAVRLGRGRGRAVARASDARDAHVNGGPIDELPDGLRLVPRAQRVAALRRALSGGAPIILPGASDALTARLIERAGLSALYMTGAGVANTQFGVADIGMIGLGEMAEQLRRIAAAVSVPVIADGDTGYGGPVQVMRTMREYEAAGAAGIQLEDQEMPKRCGHFDGKRLVSAEDMVGKVIAARRARTDDTVIVARTDALGVLGIDEAIRRGELLVEAGADVLFIEAPESEEQYVRIAEHFQGVPLVANVVEGAKSPQLTYERFAELGYRIILFANLLNRVAAVAVRDAVKELVAQRGSHGLEDRMLTWGERQELVGLARLDALEDDIMAQALRHQLGKAPS